MRYLAIVRSVDIEDDEVNHNEPFDDLTKARLHAEMMVDVYTLDEGIQVVGVVYDTEQRTIAYAEAQGNGVGPEDLSHTVYRQEA